MDAETLRARQAPFKDRYRNDPETARATLQARASLDLPDVACTVETHVGTLAAGLHPATGGDGVQSCSAEMLLQALVGCAGVTLRAVSTALAIPVRGGTIHAEGDLDFRGTLGVDKLVPVGYTAIRLRFELDTDATPEQLAKLVSLTERYCVVYQTLRAGVSLTTFTQPVP